MYFSDLQLRTAYKVGFNAHKNHSKAPLDFVWDYPDEPATEM